MSYSRSYRPTSFYRATGTANPYGTRFLPPSQYWAQVNAAKKGAAIALAQVTRKKTPVAAAKKKAPKKKPTVVHKPHQVHAHAPTHSSSGVGRSIGEMVGGMIPVAGPIAEKALGWLGDKLEDGIGSLFGFGEYKVENNSLMEGGGNVIPEGGRPPQVTNAFKHDGSAVVVRHQEPLGDIITSSNAGEFKLQNFFIQPGLATSFPWLASMAQNFQQYRILGMLFEFRSMAADAISGTNIALGTVTMATNYNSSQPNYVSKKDMQNSEYATSTKPSLSVFHPIECSPEVSAEEVLYIRNGAVPEADDQRLYDWGNFQIATSGFQGTNVTIGELWVTYEVALIKPKAVSTTGSYILAYHGLSSSGGTVAGAPFGGMIDGPGNTLRVYRPSSSITQISLDRTSGIQLGQRFLVVYYARGASAAVFPGSYTLGGCAFVGDFWDTLANTSRVQAPADGATVTQYMTSYVIEITDVSFDPFIGLNDSVLPFASFDLVIAQLPYSM